MHNIRQQVVVFQFIVHGNLLEIDSQSSSVYTSLLENEVFKHFFKEFRGRTIREGILSLFTMKMSPLKVFAVTLIEMIKNSENASSKFVDNTECYFLIGGLDLSKVQLTYSCRGWARNSLENTVRIVSPTQRPLVKVVNVK